MSDDILSLTAGELVAQYRSKRLSPVEATQAALGRIAELNPIYNAFVLVDEARALKDARSSEARWQRGEPAGAVDGVPATVKDLIVTEGWPTRRGSRTIDPKQFFPVPGEPWTLVVPAMSAFISPYLSISQPSSSGEGA